MSNPMRENRGYCIRGGIKVIRRKVLLVSLSVIEEKGLQSAPCWVPIAVVSWCQSVLRNGTNATAGKARFRN